MLPNVFLGLLMSCTSSKSTSESNTHSVPESEDIYADSTHESTPENNCLSLEPTISFRKVTIWDHDKRPTLASSHCFRAISWNWLATTVCS
jgi:hypothetical protein